MTIKNDNYPLLTGFSQPMKTFSVYDGFNRLIELYEAITDAPDGHVCLLTEYEYDGISNRVLKSKESNATWQAIWDI